MNAFNTLKTRFGFSDEFANELLKVGEVRVLQSGELIEDQGQELDFFLFVLSGMISIYRDNYDGAERFAGFIPEGYMFSESFLLEPTKSFGRYQVLEEATVLSIPSELMLKYHDESLEFNKVMANHLAQKLQFSARMLFVSHEKNTNRKVGLSLDSLYRVTKRKNLPLSVENLSSMLGMSRNTVSKSLDYWEEKGAIVNSKATVSFTSDEPFKSITDGTIF